MRGAWLVLGLAACGGPEKDTGETLIDTDVTDTDTGGGGDTDADEPQSLTGTLKDQDGQAVAGARVKFCNVLRCVYADSDATGAYSFLDVPPMAYSLEPVPPDGKATVLVPLTLEPNENANVDIVIPDLDPAKPLTGTPAEIELGSGLFVTVSTDLEAPFGLDAATEAAGVQATVLPPLEGVTGTAIASWYLDPFNYKSATGLPFRIENQWGLAEGAELHVWVGSYDDFAWLDAGMVTVTDGFLVGAGKLPLLSTVILVQE